MYTIILESKSLYNSPEYWKEQNAQQHGAVWTTSNHLPLTCSEYFNGELRKCEQQQKTSSIGGSSTYVKILHRLPNPYTY